MGETIILVVGKDMSYSSEYATQEE
jgi:hypothetical protein